MISLQEKRTLVSNSTAVNDSIASYAKRDFAGAVAIYTEDAVVSDPTGNYVGKLEILSQLKSWSAAFPDAKSEVTNQITDGDRVATAFTFRGTHTGPLSGSMGTIAATGKRIELRSCVICEVVGDKATLQRQYFDLATLLRQLGVTG